VISSGHSQEAMFDDEDADGVTVLICLDRMSAVEAVLGPFQELAISTRIPKLRNQEAEAA